MSFYDFVAKESISEGFVEFWLFVFVKMAILVKIQMRALYDDFSQIITDLLNVTNPKENHMIYKHKKFQLFSFSTLPIALILSVRLPAIEFVQGSTNFVLRTFQWERFFKPKKGYYMYSGTN